MKNLSLFLLALVAVNSNSVFAESLEYKCFSYYWNGHDGDKGTMNLTVNAQEAHGDILEESWDEEIGGKLNPAYKSRGAVKYVKFGYNLILEKVLLSGGKELRDGEMGGFARVEGQAEGGFYQYKFICKLNESNE